MGASDTDPEIPAICEPNAYPPIGPPSITVAADRPPTKPTRNESEETVPKKRHREPKSQTLKGVNRPHRRQELVGRISHLRDIEEAALAVDAICALARS